MKCSNCGIENRPGVHFCEECGQPLHEISASQSLVETESSSLGNLCPACGYVNRAGIHYCEECGNKLETESPGSMAAPLDNRCTVCGYVNRLGVEFCEECGNPLTHVHLPETKKQPSRTFWQKTVRVGGLVGGIFILLLAVWIFILGPRQIDPPAGMAYWSATSPFEVTSLPTDILPTPFGNSSVSSGNTPGQSVSEPLIALPRRLLVRSAGRSNMQISGLRRRLT